MIKNFIAEVIHASRFFKTPKGVVTDLTTTTAEIKDLHVTHDETVDNELIVKKHLDVKSGDSKNPATADIDKLNVRTNVQVDGNLQVNENVTVNKQVTIKKKLVSEVDSVMKNAAIETATIDDIHKDSKVWGVDDKNSGMPSTLSTSAKEYSDSKENKNWNGSGSKVARSNHTHKIPEAIKNPNKLIIYEYSSETSTGHRGRGYSYDGSPMTDSGDARFVNDGSGSTGILIDYNFTGAAPKVHTSEDGGTYGQATDKRFGHSKLFTYDTSQFIDTVENGSGTSTVPNIDKMKQYHASTVSALGSNAGTALTPASLAAYSEFMTAYVEDTFLKKPKGSEPLTINGRTIINGNLDVNGIIKLGNSSYLQGELGSEVTGTAIIYSQLDNTVGMLQLGLDPATAPVLTSLNNGHLYISHSTYNSKLSDYEIETIITAGSSKQYKKWVPSKAGFYRIYMIGGGGLGAPAIGWALKDADASAKSSNSIQNDGYAYGDICPGFGGCGAPVVIVDLKTKDAPTTKPVSVPSIAIDQTEYYNDGVNIEMEGYFSISELPNPDVEGMGDVYSGTISISHIKATGNNVSGYFLVNEEGSVELVPKQVFAGASIKSTTASVNIQRRHLSGITINDALDSTDDNPKKYGMGTITINSDTLSDLLTFSSFPCKLTGSGVDESAQYNLQNITFPSITITLISQKSEESGEQGEISGDINDGETDDVTEDLDESTTDVEDAEESDNDPATSIGVVFTFLNTPAYSAAKTHGRANRKAFVRCVGANGFSTVGEIINPLNSDYKVLDGGSGKITDRRDVSLGKSGVSTAKIDKMSYTAKEDPLSNADFKTGFEVFVGHGYDTFTLGANMLTQTNIASYALHPTTEPLGKNTLLPSGNNKLQETLNPYGVYLYGDPFADWMHGGTTHMSGVNGWLLRSTADDVYWEGNIGSGASTYTSGLDAYGYNSAGMMIMKNSSGVQTRCHLASARGYHGGPPGSINVTGYVPTDPGFYKSGETTGSYNTNSQSNMGQTGGKGSAGNVKASKAWKLSGNAQIVLSVQAGSGASLAISDLDGYSGAMKDSDMSTTKTMLYAPGMSPKVGGYGYYGGGQGGGAGLIARKSNNAGQVNGVVACHNKVSDAKFELYAPLVIIAYLGSSN